MHGSKLAARWPLFPEPTSRNRRKRTLVLVSKVDGVAVVIATLTNFWEPVEGEEGVTPEPSSLREATIENEGCWATPVQQQLARLLKAKCLLVDLDIEMTDNTAVSRRPVWVSIP